MMGEIAHLIPRVRLLVVLERESVALFIVPGWKGATGTMLVREFGCDDDGGGGTGSWALG
jgi:hypothetical protein